MEDQLLGERVLRFAIACCQNPKFDKYFSVKSFKMNENEKLESFVKYCTEGNVKEVENQLICGEIDLGNEYFTREYNALRHAVKSKNIEMVTILVKHGAKVNSGFSLQYACKIGNYEIVKILINAGADVNFSGTRFMSASLHQRPLFYAVRHRRVRIVKLLLEKGAKFAKDVNVYKLSKYFDEKFDQKALDILKLLLDHKIISSLNFFLKLAVIEKDVVLMKFLVNEAGVDVNYTIKSGFYVGCSPLSVACQKGNYEIAEILINAGANVNRPQNELHRPLSQAVQRKNVKLVKLLLQKGATFHKNERLDSFSISDYFNDNFDAKVLKIIKLLLDYQLVDVESLFSIALVEQHVSLVKLLIDDGIDLDAIIESDDEECDYLTPLCVACVKRNTTIVEILLKNGADPNKQSPNGRTPLIMCTELPEIEMLLSFGADINATDTRGNTALHHCQDEEIMTFLVCRGIDTEIRNNENQTARDILQKLPSDYLLGHYEGIMEEIRTMKNISLNNYGTTLHDILLMNKHELSRYVNNVNLKTILEDPKFDKKFCRLGSMLREKFESGKEREKLMDFASQFLDNLAGRKIPKELYLMIFKYFSDNEINSAFFKEIIDFKIKKAFEIANESPELLKVIDETLTSLLARLEAQRSSKYL